MAACSASWQLQVTCGSNHILAIVQHTRQGREQTNGSQIEGDCCILIMKKESKPEFFLYYFRDHETCR